MIRTGGALLLLNAVWNVVVWPPFLRRVLRDPRARDEQGRATTFLRVHAGLIGVTAVLTLASLVPGVRLVRTPVR
jgi:hypothetical protein